MQVIDTLSQSIKQSTVRDPHNEPRSKVFTNKLVAEYASESMVPITLPKPKKAPQKKSLLAALVAQHLKEVNPNQAKPGKDTSEPRSRSLQLAQTITIRRQTTVRREEVRLKKS